MGRTKESGEKMREATHEKILSAAITLFAERGCSATSAKDIADAAGVSVGLMYHYYKTKEEVFGGIVRDALGEMNELISMLENEKCPKAGIEMLMKEISNEFAGGPEFAQWMVILSHPMPKKADFEWMDGFMNYHRNLTEGIAKLIKRGQKTGDFRDGNPMQLAQFVVGTFQGLCNLQLILKDDFHPPSAEMLTMAIIKEAK